MRYGNTIKRKKKETKCIKSLMKSLIFLKMKKTNKKCNENVCYQSVIKFDFFLNKILCYSMCVTQWVLPAYKVNII